MNLHLGVPQIIYLVLIFFGLGTTLAEHGKPKTGKHNFFITLIAAAVEMILLVCGGFFG